MTLEKWFNKSRKKVPVFHPEYITLATAERAFGLLAQRGGRGKEQIEPLFSEVVKVIHVSTLVDATTV